MSIGDSITLVSCLAGFMIALPALLICLNLIFPEFSSRAAKRLSRGAITPFFVGLFTVPIFLVPSLILSSLGSVPQFFGIILLMMILIWGFTGMAVVARAIGQRLFMLYHNNENPSMEIVVGALVLSFAVAFPIIGWFIILFFSLIIGAGTLAMATMGRTWDRIFRRRTPPKVKLSQEQWIEGQPA